MKQPPADKESFSISTLLPTSRRGWAALLIWFAAVAFCVQFALASAAELEPQAASLGWILVLILLAGGLGVRIASLQMGRHPRG
jgi:hypothetical protein